MHSQREHLIPAAAAAAAACEADPAAATTPTTCQRGRGRRKVASTANSNKLLETFSEFLATRNHHVIFDQQQQQPERSSAATRNQRQYDKLVSGQPKYQLNARYPVQAAGVWRKPLARAKHGSNHRRTISMLGALFSLRRPQSSRHKRSLLLLELIRAPTVLAALFSLLLVVTLIVLYALSFIHHNHNLCQHQDERLFSASSSAQTTTTTTQTDKLQIGTESRHRISGRDLPPPPPANDFERLSRAQEDDDQDQEEVREEEDELPEGLSRALSVQTECGLLMGSAKDNGLVFGGIPYASPPVGRRRWQRPRPIWLDPELCNSTGTELSQEEEADQLRPAQAKNGSAADLTGGRERKRRPRKRRSHCAQLDPVTNRFTGQEDCLYLDIYLPRLDRDQSKLRPKLPVMVYIHGGFLAFGSSSGHQSWMKARPSARLAAELNVVIVAFNYRLQALGFLTLAQLETGGGANSSASSEGGNFGLWDQLTALNWIKRNIESFGGDSQNIVLFGPDSASSLVWALLSQQTAAPSQSQPALPSQEPLFRAAWLTNPTIFYDLPYDLAGQHYQRLFQHERCQRRESATAKRRVHEDQKRSNLRDCLMELGGEEVMRHYLGTDHPSYRLDDQNSLPIHGIFVDQFVTVDGELVRDSFPFSGAASTSTSKETNNNSAAAAHYFAQQPAKVNQTNETDGRANTQTKRRQTIELLIGSSEQAAEHWPCPRNVNQWSWDDFKRYVATSLNSFATDLYRRAAQVYRVPKRRANYYSQSARANKTSEAEDDSQQQPARTYLSMVSDIRQICPINELVDRLQPLANVHRYIVESSPEMSTAAGNYANHDSVQTTTTTGSRPTKQFAYHTRELAAFFGYEFEPATAEAPSEGDLKFQTKIRQMVSQFVHKQTAADEDDVSVEMDSNGKEDKRRRSVVVLDARTGQTKYAQNYRELECSMWRRHLGKSYAWIS